MLDDASDRLFTASAVIETDADSVPTISLLMNSIALHTIPTVLENLPYAVRTSEFCVFS